MQSLYARGSVLVTLLASVVVSGLLPFWQDFFALWTHGAVPYDPVLTVTLLIGTAAAAPSILALGYANYSNRGDLLVRTKALQLAVFLVLSVILIPSTGLLGAAIAVVASELLIQFGVLGRIILQQTLQHPLRHLCFSGGGDDRGDAGGLGAGNGDPAGAPVDRTDSVLCRMRAVARGCRWRPPVRLSIESVRARLTAAIPR